MYNSAAAMLTSALLIGLYLAVLMSVVTLATNWFSKKFPPPGDVPTRRSSMLESVVIRVWVLCFLVAYCVPIFLVPFTVDLRLRAGLEDGMVAISWLALGGVPVTVAALRGREQFLEFRARVEAA
jgi:hypothetical protein